MRANRAGTAGKLFSKAKGLLRCLFWSARLPISHKLGISAQTHEKYQLAF